jgi:hypothetical protein
MRPICEYCNGRKKTNIYYETYMRVLQWSLKNQQLLRDLYASIAMVVKKLAIITRPICEFCIFEMTYGNYSKKDVNIVQCSF